MSTLQKLVLGAFIACLIGLGLFLALVSTHLRQKVATLELRQQETQSALAEKNRELERERERATNAEVAVAAQEAKARKNPTEVLKLRGEVGRLQRENTTMGATNAISKATATPEARRMLREMQKGGMAVIYNSFAQSAKLSPEQKGKLNDLLADHIMDGLGYITTALRDKLPSDQVEASFAPLKAELERQIEELIGADGLTQYQGYTKNLLAAISAEQFKGMMTGSDTERNEKSTQLRKALEDALQTELINAGLPADYQAVPMLNLANIASEELSERSLKLMDSIYQRASASAGSFLSTEELAKFQDFRGLAMTNSRGALSMNRVMMAPISN